MILFCQASCAHRSVIMTVFLAALIFSLFSLFATFGYEKRKLYRYIDTGLFVLLFAILAVLANISSKLNEGLSVDIAFPVPMTALWIIVGAALLFLIFEAVMRYRRRGEQLSRDCIKQAMDMLPCAVCYFSPSGDVKLCNLQMHRLFDSLAQKELQTLDDLITALSKCNGNSKIVKLSQTRQTYLFPDRKVWRYSQSEITAQGVTYTEALFSDVTELYEKNLELQKQTAQLEKISLDIKQLSDNVQTLAKEKEILSAKSKLHDQMGSGLLAIRQILLQKTASEENAAAVMQFRRAIRILQEENSRPQSDVAEFISDAAVSGIRVIITGELPHEKEPLCLLLPLMREACVNAARHADATALYITAKQTADNIILCISNNGKPPQSEVVPHGGLADHIKHITDVGGNMEITSFPSFMLTVTLPSAEKSSDPEELQ